MYVFVTTAFFPLFTPTPSTFSHPLFRRMPYPSSTALSRALILTLFLGNSVTLGKLLIFSEPDLQNQVAMICQKERVQVFLSPDIKPPSSLPFSSTDLSPLLHTEIYRDTSIALREESKFQKKKEVKRPLMIGLQCHLQAHSPGSQRCCCWVRKKPLASQACNSCFKAMYSECLQLGKLKGCIVLGLRPEESDRPAFKYWFITLWRDLWQRT